MKTNSRKQFILVAAFAVAFTLTTQAVDVSPEANTVGIINRAYSGGAGYIIGPPLKIEPKDLNTLLPPSIVPVGSAAWKYNSLSNDFQVMASNTVKLWENSGKSHWGCLSKDHLSPMPRHWPL